MPKQGKHRYILTYFIKSNQHYQIQQKGDNYFMASQGNKMGVFRPIKEITGDIKKLIEELDATVNAQETEEKQEEKPEDKKDKN